MFVLCSTSDKVKGVFKMNDEWEEIIEALTDEQKIELLNFIYFLKTQHNDELPPSVPPSDFQSL